MITGEQVKILEIIHKLRGATAKEISRYALPDLHPRTLRRRLLELVEGKYIGAYGGQFERKYHLKKRGAEEVGLKKLSSQYRPHYGIQPPHPGFDTMRRIQIEVEWRAGKHRWKVLRGLEARRSVTDRLVADVRAKQGPDVPEHAIIPYGFKIHPDLVLLINQEPIILIFTTPFSTPEFWRGHPGKKGKRYKGRIERYAQINSIIRVIAIVFPNQLDEVREVLSKSQNTRRYLLASHDQLDKLFAQLENVETDHQRGA